MKMKLVKKTILLIIQMIIVKKYKDLFNLIFRKIYLKTLGYIGDWGLGIGDWGLGIGPNTQSPIPNPQSPLR